MSQYSRERKRFLSSEELDAGIREVAEAACAEKVRFAALGGYAMQLYGSDRWTTDLDVVASGPIEALPSVRPLSFGGYTATSSLGFPIDIILKDDDSAPLYDDALQHAVCIEGVPTVTVPYLMVIKMAAGREKDTLDLHWLLAAYDEPRTVEEARRIVRKHLGWYAVKEFDQELEMARWKKKAGKE